MKALSQTQKALFHLVSSNGNVASNSIKRVFNFNLNKSFSTNLYNAFEVEEESEEDQVKVNEEIEKIQKEHKKKIESKNIYL